MRAGLASLCEYLRSKWRSPRTFTTLIPTRDASIEATNARLAELAPALRSGLRGVPGLHSFRLLGVPGSSPGEPVRILLNSVHDRPLEIHLEDLAAAAGPELAKALGAAEGTSDPGELPALLRQHRRREQTFHLGVINQTVEDILAGEHLLDAMERFADAQLDTASWSLATPAERIRREMKAHILAQPDDAGLPRAPLPPLTFGERWLRFLDLLISFAFPAIGVLAPHIAAAIRRIGSRPQRGLAWVAFGLWWLYGAVFTAGALVLVRLGERMESDRPTPAPDPAKVERLEAVEDLQLKNAVTLWFPVRPSWIRRLLLRVILWGSERGCRHFWTDGALAGIDTIHYARILQVDGGQVMIFMSDYDGSLDRYLMDFLGVGSSAVVPISSNVDGCPPTRWLFHQEDPATFGPRWRSLIRAHQLEIPVWFSAYPNLSVRDILSNAALRDGLFIEHMSESEAARWTAML